MAQELIAALQSAVDALEAELCEDIRFVRLQTLRRALSLYVDPEGALDQLRSLGPQVIQDGQVARGSGHTRPIKPDIGSFGAGSRSPGRRTSVEKSQALDATAMLLRNRSGPVPTREILEHLNDLGIEVGGSSPMNNLSATLSNSDRFESHGRSGWILKEVEFQSSNFADEVDPDIYRHISMEFLDEQPREVIADIANFVEFTSDVSDYVKDELTTRFKRKTGYDYEVNTGKFYQAFVKELNEMVQKVNS